MKVRTLLVGCVLGALVSVVACETGTAADVSVGVQISSVDDFYEPLSAQGYWVEVGSYGRCWHPYYVAASWRPYCDGTWVWTDDGWYWESDEPWGWACYHYGRWVLDPYYGWVWVPDIVWGPAWVCFREGGGYCGWAPLPPGWHGGVISVDLVPAAWFVFVSERHFGDHLRARNLIVNNTTVINRTTMISRTRKISSNRVIADGPRMQQIQRVNRERIRTATVTELRQHEKAPAIVHRPGPARRNDQSFQRPEVVSPEHGRPHGNPPEIIRGAPNAPGPPSTERPGRGGPPAEQRQGIEPRPGAPPPAQRPGPPSGPRGAPPPPHEKGPPPEVERHEEPGRDRQGGPPGGVVDPENWTVFTSF
jgi:hypothetical protein